MPLAVGLLLTLVAKWRALAAPQKVRREVRGAEQGRDAVMADVVRVADARCVELRRVKLKLATTSARATRRPTSRWTLDCGEGTQQAPRLVSNLGAAAGSLART